MKMEGRVTKNGPAFTHKEELAAALSRERSTNAKASQPEQPRLICVS